MSEESNIEPEDRTMDKSPHADDTLAQLACRHTADEWTKLIRKLRWIGQHAQAEQLQSAVGRLPPESRASVLAEPQGTD